MEDKEEERHYSIESLVEEIKKSARRVERINSEIKDLRYHNLRLESSNDYLKERNNSLRDKYKKTVGQLFDYKIYNSRLRESLEFFKKTGDVEFLRYAVEDYLNEPK